MATLAAFRYDSAKAVERPAVRHGLRHRQRAAPPGPGADAVGPWPTRACACSAA
ncbi:hypothetical protein ACU4GD_17600 [Cupriavidus basilensis]